MKLKDVFACHFDSSRYKKGFVNRRKKALIAAKKMLKSLTRLPSRNYKRIPNTSFGLKFWGHRESSSAKDESLLQRRARSILRKHGIYVPEVYGIIKFRGYDIIVMEHIVGKAPVRNYDLNDRLWQILGDIGVHHGDLHTHNIIIESKTKEVVVIDWEYAYFD